MPVFFSKSSSPLLKKTIRSSRVMFFVFSYTIFFHFQTSLSFFDSFITNHLHGCYHFQFLKKAMYNIYSMYFLFFVEVSQMPIIPTNQCIHFINCCNSNM